MFGKIVYNSDSVAHISIPNGTPVSMDLMNMHVVFEDSDKKILGEIDSILEDTIKITFLGELTDNDFIGGLIKEV